MRIEDCKRAIGLFERERVIGEITVYLPAPPHYSKIANYERKKVDQKFYYTIQPHKNQEPDDNFLAQEFDRFQNGYWFFNNGNLEWITPCNYFFLNYWKDKGKTMKFIDAQRDSFLWWWQIENMNNMAGGNLVTCRRHGKTAIATCVAYFRTSTNPFHRCGIQSKTNKDGKTVFNKLIKSWQKLPEWLKPVDSGETRPASILEFSEPRTRAIKGNKKVYEDVLDSSVDFRSSEEDAYDGEELGTMLEDEVGKTVECDTDTRWGVLQFCLLDGATIVGKCFRTTTVEDMEKRGGKYMWKTWLDSLIATMSEETNRTNSMLTNLFVPADFGFKGVHPKTGEPFVNEYGISNRELTRQYILSLWDNLSGEKLKAAQRKNPLTIKHAFQMANNTGTFDVEIYDYLELQKEYLEGTNPSGEKAPKNLVRRVTFSKNPNGLAEWRDDPDGHAQIVWDYPNQSYANARKVAENNLYKPMNTESMVGGADPFAATITSGAGSMGVLYIYRKGDLTDPENSGMMVCRYAQRTRMVEDFHKMVMIICLYWGCKVNYECDINDFYEAFLRNGFKNYVMWTPKVALDPSRKNHTPRPGTLSKDPFAFQKQFQVLVEYLFSRWHKIYFIEAILQLMEFDVNDRTKYDDVIAFTMALLGGWESGNAPPKDTRAKVFIKFKNAQRDPNHKYYVGKSRSKFNLN